MNLSHLFKRSSPPPVHAGTGAGADATRAASHATAAPPIADSLNPYVEARREWNERYGDHIAHARNWRLLALASVVISGMAVCGLAWIGAQSRFVPYVVQVDQLGQAQAVRPADKADSADPRVVKAYLARFVADWRGIGSDRELILNAVKQAYTMLPKGYPSLSRLNEYFAQNDPFRRAESATVAVQVNNLLQVSEKTWQIDWTETTRDRISGATSQARWRASATVLLQPPNDEASILQNPLGVYITDLTWAQQL